LFLLKKLIGPLLFPHSVFLGLLGIGVLILWFSSKRKLARILVTISAVGFFFLSYPNMWKGLVSEMEDRYPALDTSQTDLSGVRWVVVLGGGGTLTDRLPPTSQLSPPSQARFVEGIRIWKSISEAKLLLSGDSDAAIMQSATSLFGVPPGQVVIDSKSRDTEEQAVVIKGLVGTDRFVLVTSALHMPRSMGLFAKQGLAPIPAPADFLVKHEQRQRSLPGQMFLPNAAGGFRSDLLFHEWLGILWARLRGRIQ